MSGHGGVLALDAARQHGVTTMFTLSGGHVFPLYDAATRADPPVRLIDVRHEQTAVFAAEATARLTRVPGLAVVTAGPGVTNSVSAIVTAHFNGAPVVVLGGRAPDYRWGAGSLQEIDHPPLLAPVTKRAWTEHATAQVAASVDEAFRLAATPHRGPVFLDVSLEALYDQAEVTPLAPVGTTRPPPRTPRRSARSPGCWPGPSGRSWCSGRTSGWTARRPLRGTPRSNSGYRSSPTARAAASSRPATRCWSPGPGRPPSARRTWSWWPARRWTSGSATASSARASTPPGWCTWPIRPASWPRTARWPAAAAGDLTAFFTGLTAELAGASSTASSSLAGRRREWLARLQEIARAAIAADAALLASDAQPIHPMRVYGELTRQLADDAVVIGDGGDFVSFAGKYVEPRQPGHWLDPGPFGCLGTGLGYAIAARLARPSAQVVLLLGDGAAGFSLMDADTLVRHGLPVVMVCGNNGAWGLEKHPMRALYGYDVAADLQPGCRYDEVVRALGGAGELVTEPGQIGPALRRAFAAGVPYLVNVVTDAEIAYPRSTTGV